MLDVARAAVLLVALGCAVRHRFVPGIVVGAGLACALAWIFLSTLTAVGEGIVSGEYGPALVYFGPTMVPLGRRSFWQYSPALVQVAFAALSAIPAMRVLREPPSRVTTPFLLVFIPNAMIAVVACLAAFLLWHQESTFPEYWGDHL